MNNLKLKTKRLAIKVKFKTKKVFINLNNKLDELSHEDFYVIVKTLFFTGCVLIAIMLLFSAIAEDLKKNIYLAQGYNNALEEVLEVKEQYLCIAKYRKDNNIRGGSFEPYEWCEENNNVYVEVVR